MIDIKQHSLYKPMEIDTVVSSVFSIYLKNFFVLYISSLIAVFAVQLFIYNLGLYEIIQKSTNPEEVMENLGPLMNTIFMVMGFTVVVYGLLNSFLLNYLFTKEFDAHASIGSIISDSLKKHSIHMIFFLILALLILIVGMAFGIIFFVIGALIVAVYLGTTLITGTALIVTEEKNAIEAIGRSFSMAHKDFWPTLGSVVLFVLILILISIVLSALVAIPYAFMFIESWRESGNFAELFSMDMSKIGIWSVVINSLISALTYPLFAILSLILYVKLKYIEDQKINIDIPR